MHFCEDVVASIKEVKNHSYKPERYAQFVAFLLVKWGMGKQSRNLEGERIINQQMSIRSQLPWPDGMDKHFNDNVLTKQVS